MTQPASVGLKYGFLIVLYLFLVWVAFSTLRDLRRGRGRAGGSYSEYEPGADATGMYDAVSGPLDASGFEPRLLVEHAAGHESGIAYDLSETVTLAAAMSRYAWRTRSRPPSTSASPAKAIPS